MVADHVLVKLRPGSTEEDLAAVNRRHGTSIRRKMHTEGFYLVQAEACDVNTVNRLVAAYKAEAASVAYAEPDGIVHVDIDTKVPDDPDFGKLWGLHNDGSHSSAGAAAVRVPEESKVYAAYGFQYAQATTAAGVSGTAVYCGQGKEGEFPAEVDGNIAVMTRTPNGGMQFHEKVTNAMNAGAVAAVIHPAGVEDTDNRTDPDLSMES